MSNEVESVRIGGTVYPFKNGLMLQEGMAVEKVTGMTIKEWGEALEAGSLLALSALAWVLMKRQEPTLAYRDVDFQLGDMAMLDADGNEVSGEPDEAVDGAPGNG